MKTNEIQSSVRKAKKKKRDKKMEREKERTAPKRPNVTFMH